MLINRNSVLGIDASTNSLAFCKMDNKVPVEWGEMLYRKDQNLFKRLASIEQRAGIIVEKYKDVEYVLIEAPVKVQNTRIAISLAYSYGIVAAKFAARGIEVNDVPPVTWQKYIGNNGFSRVEKQELKKEFPGKSASWYTNKARSIRKQRTMDWVKQNFGIDTTNDNVADAISIAAYAVRYKSQ